MDVTLSRFIYVFATGATTSTTPATSTTLTSTVILMSTTTSTLSTTSATTSDPTKESGLIKNVAASADNDDYWNERNRLMIIRQQFQE